MSCEQSRSLECRSSLCPHSGLEDRIRELARVTAERDEAQKRIRFLEEMGVECVNDWKRIEEQATRITAAEAERDRAREALDALMFEAKVYAAHNKLEPLAQRMYDIAEAALAPAQGDA